MIPKFLGSGDVCPVFQSQDGFPCLHALLPVCHGFLRFTSDVTPADHLVASMAAEQFHRACEKTDVLLA